MRTRIACVGEVMLEFTIGHDQSARLEAAGDTYNTAVYLKRWLADGTETVAFVTNLGNDSVSDFALGRLAQEGLDTAHVGRCADRTIGLYAVSVDDEGERRFNYWRSESAARTLFEQPRCQKLEALDAFGLVYLSGITLAIVSEQARTRLFEWAPAFRRNGGIIAFDSNYRPALWPSITAAREAISRMWSLTDIALPSRDDEVALFGEKSDAAVLRRITAAGARSGCLKRGKDGPISFAGAVLRMERCAPDRIVDTTAAGDSFNAGYLAATIRGQGQEVCMAAGHRLAAEVIQHRGAIIPRTAMPASPWMERAERACVSAVRPAPERRRRP